MSTSGAAATASAGEAARLAPAASTTAARSEALRFHTVTSWPRSSSTVASLLPIAPIPSTLTCAMWYPLSRLSP